jgi:DNA-binding transcriptional regulator LsrR (DeoR family)
MIPVERRLLIKVANMYYIENMKQSDIAAKLGINRTTVSKYLKRAMDAGIVKISIVDDSYAYLEAALERKFNLKEVYIVSSSPDSDEVKNNMGKAGLAFLKRIIAINKKIGFAWGTAIGALARQSALEHCSPVSVDFVPLVGGPENIDSEFHVNTICYKVAQAFSSNSHYLYAPAITKTPEIREAIMQDVNYAKIVEYWNTLDIAFVGIGAPVKSSNLVWAGAFGKESIDGLAKAGVVGEICSIFYDINGLVVKTDFTDKIIAIGLDKLRKLDYSIGIAASKEKVPAIYGALKGKIINVLISDEETAKLLLEYEGGSPI